MSPDKGTAAHQAWASKWTGRWWPNIVVNEALGDWTNPVDDYRVSVLHPDFPGWIFHLTISAPGSLVGFEVIASSDMPDAVGHPEDTPGLTARFLRQVPFGEIEAAARRAQLSRVRERTSWVSKDLIERYAKAFAEVPRPGRRGRDERSYAEVAAMYVELCDSGSPRPVLDMRDRLHLSDSQIRNILYAARRKGLLTAAPSGRHGGELTPKALSLLRKDD